MAQAKSRLGELENDVKYYKNKLQQAKSYQAKLENDIKSLKSMRFKQDILEDTTKSEPTIRSGDKKLQTDLKKLNYLWLLAVNIYKSCKFLYDYMGTSIIWNEILFLCNEMSSHGNQVAPVIVKMANYSEKMINREHWYSSPFFAFEEGYKAQIRVDTAMYGDGNITHDHVFVHLILINGPYDDKLITQQSGEWPMKGTFMIELLNQLNDSKHRSSEVIFTCSAKGCTLRKAEHYLDKGYLIPHETICYQITSDYLQNNSLYFRISYRNAKYDYYYYHYLAKYVLFPVVAGSGVVMAVGCVGYAKIDDKFYIGQIIIFSTFLVVGSLLVGNLLGGLLWSLSTYTLVGIVVKLRRKGRRKVELPGMQKRKVPKSRNDDDEPSGVVIWCAISGASVLTNLLLVGILLMPWDIIWLIM